MLSLMQPTCQLVHVFNDAAFCQAHVPLTVINCHNLSNLLDKMTENSKFEINCDAYKFD